MRRLLVLLMTLCLFAAVPVTAAENAPSGDRPTGLNTPHRITQLTGYAWLNSSEEAKLGVLFGIELAITADYASRAPKPVPGQAPALDLSLFSPFAKAWYLSFKDVELPAIAARIDAWYVANKDQLDRPVLNVIWVELMEQSVPGSR